MKIKQQGLTLIQMLSLIGFIGVLVAIAVPYAQSYVAKEQFSPTLLGMETYKAAVESCIAQLGTHVGCNSGVHGIPVKIDMVAADEQNKNGASGYVVQDGVITAEHYAPIAGVAYPTYKLVARAKGTEASRTSLAIMAFSQAVFELHAEASTCPRASSRW